MAIDKRISGNIGVDRRDAKSINEFPLTIEESARVLGVGISELRAAITGNGLLRGRPAPKPYRQTGRNIWFLLPELERFKQNIH